MAAEEEVPPFPTGGHLCPEACQGLLGQEDGGRNEKDECRNHHPEVVPLPSSTTALPTAQEGSDVHPEKAEGPSG